MKNHNLYIHPKANDIVIAKQKCKPINNGNKPPMFQRNRKQYALRIAVVILDCLAILNCVLFFATH